MKTNYIITYKYDCRNAYLRERCSVGGNENTTYE